MKTAKFILALAAALLLVPFVSFAQTDKTLLTPVLLSIDSKDGRYAKNVEVPVYGQLVEGKEGTFNISVMANGKVIEQLENVTLTAERKEIYRGSFDKATSVIVKAKALDSEDKRFSTVGFVVGAEDFRPGYEDPADLMEFWAKQLSELRKCKLDVKLTPVELEGRMAKFANKYECCQIEINMPEGNPSRGYIAYPKGAGDKTLPIALFAHSAGVNKPFNKATVRQAIRMAMSGSGAIGLDINAHGFLDDQPQEYYDNLRENELKDYQQRPLTTREDFYFRLMYLRLVRALDYATTMPQWDGKRILVTGASQGGGQSAALCGIDSRITAACIEVPAMTDFGGRLAGHRGGWPGRVSAMAVKKDTKDLAASILPYYDGAVLLRHTKANILIEAGLVDTTCAAECVIGAFNTASSPEKALLTYPYRPHSGMPTRHAEEWKELVKNHKTEFINEQLK